MKNKVGIVLVNYKNYKVTIECLKSLQKIDNFNECEIYVVDNGSNNHSEIELEKEKEIISFVLIVLNKNMGFAYGNNVGIKKALENGCNYILLLNNDTEVKSDFLTKMLYSANSKRVVVPKIFYYYKKNIVWYAGGNINWKTGDTNHIGVGKTDSNLYNKKMYTEFASGCCILVNKEIIENVGLLSEDYFMYYEDTDYCARIKKNGYKILYEPKAVIWHKVGASNNGEYSEFMAYYMAKNRLKFLRRYSKKIWLYVGIVRTFLSGVKGILLKKNSKKSLIALIDYIKEVKNENRNNGWNRE